MPNPEPRITEADANLITERRFENRHQASEAYSVVQVRMMQQERIRCKSSSPGDLVLVRNVKLDNQKGKKLEPRWLGLRRRLMRLTLEW